MIGNFCDTGFWNVNETWNSQIPLFSSCFEDLIFSSSINILFSIILLLSLCQLRSHHSYNPLPWTWLNVSKICLAVVLLILSCIWCGVIFYDKFMGEYVPHSSIVSTCSKVVAFILVIVAMLMHRSCGVITSSSLSLFWICTSLTSIILYRTILLNYFTLNISPHSETILILSLIYYPLIFIEFLLSLFADKKKFSIFQNITISKIRDPEPYLSDITFLWFTKLIYKSRQKVLDVNDLAFNTVTITAHYSYNAFSKHWKYYLQQGQMKSLSLSWALFKTFWKYTIASIALDQIYLILLLLPPLILDRIIDFSKNDFYSWRGYLLAVAIFLSDCLGKVVQNYSLQLMFYTAIQYQSSLMGALFRKNLFISTTTRKVFNSGKLMSLMTVDAKRIQWFIFQLVSVIAAPIKIVLIIYIMWQYIGISTLAGVGVMFVLFPFSYVVMRFTWNYEDKQMKTKDIRLKHMNEILNGIKILKLYAWELPFAAKVTEIRKEEIKYIRYTLFSTVASTFVYFCAPFLISLASFATFLLIDKNHVLDPTRAFVSLTLMEQLRYALFELPDAVTEFIQFNISLGRLRKFYESENMDASIIGNNPETGEVLTIKNASLSWAPDSEWFLNDINLHVPAGKLIAVIGPVGSGKSSLLSGILGEMYKISGSIDIKGSTAYVPQQTWILNRTLRSNILLVKDMVEEKYNKILDLCCLRPDLDILPAGDMTEIGEKGVNLSGGQKLRVNLAQAVYQNKDVYLLDDPLSAVDVHVRKALFQDVIGNSGLLRKKTRILVTHDISILHEVDLIVCMKEGKINEIGTYVELISHKGSFTSFIEEYGTSKVTEEKESENERIPVKLMTQVSVASKCSMDRFECGDLVKKADDDFDVKVLTHRLIDDERMEIGGVHRGIYWTYAKHMGLPIFFLSVFSYIAYTSFEAGGNVWLSKWSSDAAVNGTRDVEQTLWRLSIYGAFGFAQVISVVLASALLVHGIAKASAAFHKNMLNSVLRSPMAFFDTTPIGRIINRFTTDMDVLDSQMFYKLDGWFVCFFSVIGSFVIIGMNTPMFLISLLPLSVAYYTLQKFHLNTFRQLTRLESTTRSPVYSLFMEAIQGVSSISAYNIKEEFIQNFEEKLDLTFLCNINAMTCNRWLNFGLNSLGSLVVFIATLSAIESRHALNPAIVGLIVSYALSVTDALKWLVRMNSELENQSISIERVNEYCHLQPEAPWDLPHVELEDSWPQRGNIVFDNYSTKYREGLDLVLKEINLAVNAGEKVGIIGRTGAGKSSFTLALFRIIEPVSGTILIDDVDVSKIGLHDLRTKLTIIPQDPVLFTGSLRMNLDPNSVHTDDEIWRSLEKSYLKTFVSNLNEGLNYELEENGSNLSAGQRQLICLARALLKNTKILVLDEATASVDMDTDSLIQETIRTAFADRTVITIAHRINTVLDYDKIVVMDSGNLVEVGNPSDLLQNMESRFYIMCKEAKLA